MILKNAKTVWVDEDSFDIPGTQLTIYTIKLEVDGQRDLHKTMSDKIATVGWEGDIEVYTNDKGKQYVRQAPKEKSESKFTPKDENSITLGLVFKTFCTVEGLLPSTNDHWAYIKRATQKLIEISNDLKQASNQASQAQAPQKTGYEDIPVVEESGYDKAKKMADSIKHKEEINLDDIPF